MMHSEGGNLQTPKTNSFMSTVPSSEDVRLENSLPQTTDEPKTAMSQQIPQIVLPIILPTTGKAHQQLA